MTRLRPGHTPGEALHKALRPGNAPRIDTVNRVCTALGVRLVVQPLHPV